MALFHRLPKLGELGGQTPIPVDLGMIQRRRATSQRDRQRRPEVVAELERIYSELDVAPADAGGGGGDVAA